MSFLSSRSCINKKSSSWCFLNAIPCWPQYSNARSTLKKYSLLLFNYFNYFSLSRVIYAVQWIFMSSSWYCRVQWFFICGALMSRHREKNTCCTKQPIGRFRVTYKIQLTKQGVFTMQFNFSRFLSFIFVYFFLEIQSFFWSFFWLVNTCFHSIYHFDWMRQW